MTDKLYPGLDVELSLAVAKIVGITVFELSDNVFPPMPRASIGLKNGSRVCLYQADGSGDISFNLFAVDEKRSPTPDSWASFGVVLEALLSNTQHVIHIITTATNELCLTINGYTEISKNLPAALALTVLKMKWEK